MMNGYRDEANDGVLQETKTDAQRVAELDKLRSKFCSKYDKWIDEAKRSNTFLRGTHFGDTYGTQREGTDDDYFPEDRTYVDTNKIPSIDYTLSRIDRLVQYIRSDEGEPIVQSEGEYSLEILENQALVQMGEWFPDLSANEHVAKLLTARLDHWRDHSDFNQVMDDVAGLAAAQRMAFTVGEWIEDETTKEPFKLTPIKIGNYWFDPKANNVKECKYIGYRKCAQERKNIEAKYGKSLDEYKDKKYIDVEHHYTRDYTTETREREIIDDDGETVTESAKVYKYPRGWRYTVKCNNYVLYDGEMKWNGPIPPIATFPWRKLPFSMVGVSVIDSTARINRAVDNLVDIISKSTFRLLPKIAVNTSAIDNPDELDEGESGAYLKFDGPIQGNIQYLQGGSPLIAAYELMQNLMSLGDEMIGAEGLNIEDAVKHDLSGDAIEGIVQSQDGIAGKQRDAWYEYLQDVYSMALQFMVFNEKDVVTVEVFTPAGVKTVDVELSAYQFDSAEIESRFDVEVFSPKNMPRNPVRRQQYLHKLYTDVGALAREDAELARLWVQDSAPPNAGALLEYISKATDPQDGMEMIDPNAAKLDLTEQETRIRMAADASKSVGDSLEKASNKAVDLENFEAAKEIAASIPLAVNTAYDQVIAGGQTEIVQPEPDQIEVI